MGHTIVYMQTSHPNLTETFVRAELNELSRRGYNVHVIARNINRDFLDQCLYAKNIHVSQQDAISDLEILKSIQPDYIHSHFVTECMRHGFPAAQKLKIPFGFTCHAYDIWKRQHRVEPEMLHLLGNDSLCLTCAVEGTKHANYLQMTGIPPSKIIITPNTIDYSHLPTRTTVPTRALNLIAVGRPVAKKGFLTAVDALRLLHLSGSNARLCFIGPGSAKDPISEFIRKCASVFPFISVEPMLSHEETLARISQADALLMPCQVAEDGDSDGIPTVLSEAMVMGVPVITCDVGSITDLVIHQETGLICRSGDPAALAQAIIRLDKLLANGNNSAILVKQARELALERSIKASVDTFLTHIKKSIDFDPPQQTQTFKKPLELPPDTHPQIRILLERTILSLQNKIAQPERPFVDPIPRKAQKLWSNVNSSSGHPPILSLLAIMDQGKLPEWVIPSLESLPTSVELILITSRASANFHALKYIASTNNVSILWWPESQEIPELFNSAIAHARGEWLLFVEPDASPIVPSLIEMIVELPNIPTALAYADCLLGNTHISMPENPLELLSQSESCSILSYIARRSLVQSLQGFDTLFRKQFIYNFLIRAALNESLTHVKAPLLEIKKITSPFTGIASLHELAEMLANHSLLSPFIPTNGDLREHLLADQVIMLKSVLDHGAPAQGAYALLTQQWHCWSQLGLDSYIEYQRKICEQHKLMIT